MAHVPTIPLAPAFQRRLSLHSPTGFQTRTDACSLSSWNLAWNDSTNHCENNSLKRYGNQIRPIKQVTLLTSAFIAVQLGHPSTIYGPWRAEVEADNNDMEIKLRNPEHFYTKITCWWGMSLAHTLPRISSSSWPGRLRAMSALQTRIKGEKENHLNEKLFHWKGTMTTTIFHRSNVVPSCLRPIAGQLSGFKGLTSENSRKTRSLWCAPIVISGR